MPFPTIAAGAAVTIIKYGIIVAIIAVPAFGAGYFAGAFVEEKNTLVQKADKEKAQKEVVEMKLVVSDTKLKALAEIRQTEVDARQEVDEAKAKLNVSEQRASKIQRDYAAKLKARGEVAGKLSPTAVETINGLLSNGEKK